MGTMDGANAKVRRTAMAMATATSNAALPGAEHRRTCIGRTKRGQPCKNRVAGGGSRLCHRHGEATLQRRLAPRSQARVNPPSAASAALQVRRLPAATGPARGHADLLMKAAHAGQWPAVLALLASALRMHDKRAFAVLRVASPRGVERSTLLHLVAHAEQRDVIGDVCKLFESKPALFSALCAIKDNVGGMQLL